MTLSGEIRIVATTKDRILRGPQPQPSVLAINDRNPDARGPEIDAGYESHLYLPRRVFDFCRGDVARN